MPSKNFMVKYPSDEKINYLNDTLAKNWTNVPLIRFIFFGGNGGRRLGAH